MTDLERCRRVDRCRVCRGSSFDLVLSLGDMPLANAFVAPDTGEREERFPLDVMLCRSCGLVQLSVVVRPDVLFRHYLYASSASPPLVEHFADLADELVRRFAPAKSLVVEIGSNDGVLLRPLAACGVRVVGVEPATNLAQVANAAGLETWNDFFGSELAGRLVRERGPAKAVLASNVLAHIDDLSNVLQALDTLLDSDGVFVAEFPYLGDLLERVEYDTIYHEHLSYFSLAPIERLFGAAGMELFDVRRLNIHGGSLRIFVDRRGQRVVSAAVAELRQTEARAGLGAGAAYQRFAARVGESREALRGLVAELRGSGRRIVALGATAKGNTLLNYCGLGRAEIEYVADSTPLKHGLLTPGTRIPIRPEGAIREDHPDYTLLLAWNYADAIVKRFADYLAAGGRFIHPIPRARVIAA